MSRLGVLGVLGGKNLRASVVRLMRLQSTASAHRYHLEIVGAGRPLLLLHGFSGDATTWHQIAAKLADRWRVIMLDILGHGASDKPPNPDSYRMDAVAADIIDLLDQLGIERAHLLGYSMGGRLALFLALRFPARFHSLILESASPGLADASERAQRRSRDEALAAEIESKGTPFFVDYWEGLPLWTSQSELPPETLESQRQQRLRNCPLGLANSLRGMGAGVQPNLWPELPALRLPTLLLVGAEDDKFRRINQAMAARLPKAQLRLISSAGHNTHLENTPAFCRQVSSFLASR